VVFSKGVPHRTQAQKIDMMKCPKRIATSISNLPQMVGRTLREVKYGKQKGVDELCP
jgi:hypothetical protein